jgi:hypothetical protein
MLVNTRKQRKEITFSVRMTTLEASSTVLATFSPPFLSDVCLSLSLSLWLYSTLDLGRFFSFLILHTIGRTPWMGDQPVARPLLAHRTTQTQNKRTQASMRLLGFEPTIPASERVKTLHAFRPCGYCDRL